MLAISLIHPYPEIMYLMMTTTALNVTEVYDN